MACHLLRLPGLPLRGSMRMQPATIICDNQRADGSPCGQTALVVLVHYHYRAGEQPAWFGARHQLSEAHYEIHCPHCGPRLQVVKF
jgi:hypothetical protein